MTSQSCLQVSAHFQSNSTLSLLPRMIFFGKMCFFTTLVYNLFMLINAHHHQFLHYVCLSVSFSKPPWDQHLDSETAWKWSVKCIFSLLYEIIFTVGSCIENRGSCIQISRRGQIRQTAVSVGWSQCYSYVHEEKQGVLAFVSQSSFQTLWTTRRAAWWPLNLTWSTQRWCTLSQQILTEVITLELLYLPVYLLPRPLIRFD